MVVKIVTKKSAGRQLILSDFTYYGACFISLPAVIPKVRRAPVGSASIWENSAS